LFVCLCPQITPKIIGILAETVIQACTLRNKDFTMNHDITACFLHENS
jgi:hypothetical protein